MDIFHFKHDFTIVLHFYWGKTYDNCEYIGQAVEHFQRIKLNFGKYGELHVPQHIHHWRNHSFVVPMTPFNYANKDTLTFHYHYLIGIHEPLPDEQAKSLGTV